MPKALLERLKPDEVVGNETLPGEVMALRTILINLAVAQARQQPMGQERRKSKSSPVHSCVINREDDFVFELVVA